MNSLIEFNLTYNKNLEDYFDYLEDENLKSGRLSKLFLMKYTDNIYV